MKQAKGLYLTPEADAMWAELVQASGLTQTRYFEQLVREAYAKYKNPSDELPEQVRLLKHIENETQKMTFVILELFNSFLHSMPSAQPGGYRPSNTLPHPWVSQAQDTMNAIITGAQYSKYKLKGNE